MSKPSARSRLAAALRAPPVSDRHAEKTKILNRLRRLEGQTRGLQKMVEDAKACVEVMTLYASAKSAFESSGDVILEAYVAQCLARGDTPDPGSSSS